MINQVIMCSNTRPENEANEAKRKKNGIVKLSHN